MHLVQSDQGTNGHLSELYEEFALRVVHWWNNWKRQSGPRSEVEKTLTSQAVTVWAVKVSTGHTSDDEFVAPIPFQPLSSSLIRQHSQREARNQFGQPTYSVNISDCHHSKDGKTSSRPTFPNNSHVSLDGGRKDFWEDIPWAMRESSILWVLGNPGSGKSTLMNYLTEHSNQPLTSPADWLESVSTTSNAVTPGPGMNFNDNCPPWKSHVPARSINSSDAGTVFGDSHRAWVSNNSERKWSRMTYEKPNRTKHSRRKKK
jgi:hypothetical protein